MKRILTLSILAIMLLGLAPSANALEVKASGQMIFQFGYKGNYGGSEGNGGKFASGNGDAFYALQRFRLRLDFIASENLYGAIQMQMGTTNWGVGGANSGGALDTTENTPKVRQAFIGWTWPDSDVKTKMGMHHLALPSAVANNPVYNSIAAGVSTTYDITDEFTLGGFWIRPYRNTDAATTDDLQDNDMDVFGLHADWNMSNVRVQPYVVYSRIGNDSGYWGSNKGKISAFGDDDNHSNLYIGGLALQVKPTDKLTLGFDGIYGRVNNEADLGPAGGVDKIDGFFLAAKADYRLEFGTLGGIAWYTSGDDADDANDASGREIGRMPVIGQGVFGFAPTRLGFAGAYTRGEERQISTSGMGTWGAGLYLKDVSFMENMSHALKFTYFQGTNDEDVTFRTNLFKNEGGNLYLTTKDRGFEVDLDTQWKLSNGLNLVLELGYIYMDWDNKYHGVHGSTDYGDKEFEKNNIWNTQITFEYRF